VGVVGIGFGPSNMALAVALQELNETGLDNGALSAAFFERQPRFGWHRGMLIDGATMQISFLKDLTTLRNPTSEYGFLAYLHSKGRLVDFINHKILFPTRIEFHDYLEWIAAKFEHVVTYDAEVVGMRPVFDGDIVSHVDVVVRRGDIAEPVVRRTRNVVIATGLKPRFPAGLSSSERIWHSSELLDRIERLRAGVPHLAAGSPHRFVVVGAGQSAAEVTEYLHREYPGAEICVVFSRYGYSAADDNPFANRIFDPQAVDHHFVAPANVKKMLLDYHSNTNYSVVDLDLVEELYRRSYAERVHGEQRLRILNVSRLREAYESTTGVRAAVEFLPTGEVTVLDTDIVVFATGYRPSDPVALLGEMGAWCERDASGQLRLDRDYRLLLGDRVRCGIYLQGGTEHSHGISSGLLSNTAIRAGEIVRSIADGRAGRPPAVGGVQSGHM
jgi:L-ornithine N5-monooxygenase